MLKSIIVVTIILLAGCAAPINQYNAERYHQWGSEAEFAGNYQLAEQNYEKALLNSRLGHSPKAGISMAAYNLGRIKAMLCKFGEAEKLLLEALTLQEQVSGRESGLATMRLFELARVYDASAKYSESIKNYEEAIKNVRALGIENSDPIGFAMVLHDYASVLGKAKRENESIHVKKEAEGLWSRNPGRQAGFMPTRYGQNCAKQENNT
jgi:tetratricopeptide (TPR) repeat protein